LEIGLLVERGYTVQLGRWSMATVHTCGRPLKNPRTLQRRERRDVSLSRGCEKPAVILYTVTQMSSSIHSARCDAPEAQLLGEIALNETVISRPQGAPQAATELELTAVDASMSITEVALANLRRYLSAWRLREPGARLGDDPEELHDLRVAARRLDAVLRQFRLSLPASFRQIRPTLKEVLRALGDARDLDVALLELERFNRELPKSDRQGVEPLKQYLVSERGRARGRMLSVLDSVSVQRDLQELRSLLTAHSAALELSSPNLAVNVAPELIRRRYRKVRKAADLLTSDSSIEAYHEVRGQVKRLRYALEAVAALYGKPAAEMLRAMRRWQDKLGIQQDAAVASRRLKVLASAPPKGIPPETLFLMGRLAEQYASAAVRVRKVCPKGYRKVRARWKRLRVKFEDSAVSDASKLPDFSPHDQHAPETGRRRNQHPDRARRSMVEIGLLGDPGIAATDAGPSRLHSSA
jgi:CHAD domain-containing protein